MATTTVTSSTADNIEIDIYDDNDCGPVTSIELPTVEEVLQLSQAFIALLRDPVTLAEYESDPVAFVRKYTPQ